MASYGPAYPRAPPGGRAPPYLGPPWGAPLRPPQAWGGAPHQGPLPAGPGGPPRMPDVDVHELLKREVFAAASAACSDHFEKGRPCPSEVYGVRDIYVVLDSYLAASRRERRGEFTFNFGPGQGSGSDKIGVRDTISTLTEIEVEAFSVGVPELVDVDGGPGAAGLTLSSNALGDDPRTSDPVDGAASQLAHCPRVTALFSSIGGQAFSDYRGRNHHFEFAASLLGDATKAGARMALEPIEGRYTLTEPHTDLHGMQLRLFSPDEPLCLPPAVIDGVQLFAVNNGGTSYLRIVGPPLEPGGDRALDFAGLLQAGDRVFLDNVQLAAGLAGRDALAAYLTKPDGLFVGGTPLAATGGGAAGTQFELDPNINLTALGYAAGDPLPQAPSTLSVAGDATTAAVQGVAVPPIRLRIAKNRMRLPVRFRTVVPRLTNYIAP